MAENEIKLKNDPFNYGMPGSSKAEGRNVSLAEFNKNPGNIMYYQVDSGGELKMGDDGKPKISSYAQGLIDDGFEIQPGAANGHGVMISFNSLEDGLEAKKQWWSRTKNWKAYKGKTVDQALMTYSGSGYDSTGIKNHGIDGSRLMSSLNNNELDSLSVNQMQREDPTVFKQLVDNNLIFSTENGFSFTDPGKVSFKPPLLDPVTGTKLNMGDGEKIVKEPEFNDWRKNVKVEDNSQHKNVVEKHDGTFTVEDVGDFSTKQKLDGELVVNEEIMDQTVLERASEDEGNKRKLKNLQSFVDRGRELTTEQKADYDKLKPSNAEITMEGTLDPNDPINKEAFEKQGGLEAEDDGVDVTGQLTKKKTGPVVTGNDINVSSAKIEKKFPELKSQQFSTGSIVSDYKELPKLQKLFNDYVVPGSKAPAARQEFQRSLMKAIGPDNDPKLKLEPGSIAARVAELNLSDEEKLSIIEKSKGFQSGELKLEAAKAPSWTDTQFTKSQVEIDRENEEKRLEEGLIEHFGDGLEITHDDPLKVTGNLQPPVKQTMTQEELDDVEKTRLNLLDIEEKTGVVLETDEGVNGAIRKSTYIENRDILEGADKKNNNTALAHLSQAYSVIVDGVGSEVNFKTKGDWLSYAEKHEIKDPEGKWQASIPYDRELENIRLNHARDNAVLDELFSASKFSGSRFNQVVALFGGHDNEDLDFGLLERKMNEAALMFINEEQYDKMGGGSFAINSGNPLNDLDLTQKSVIIQKAKMFVLNEYSNNVEDRNADLNVEADEFSVRVNDYETRAKTYESDLSGLYKTKLLLANEKMGKTMPDGSTQFLGYKDEEFAKIQIEKLAFNTPLLNKERSELKEDFLSLQTQRNDLNLRSEALSSEYDSALNSLNYVQAENGMGAFGNDFQIQDEFQSWAEGLRGVGERSGDPLLRFIGSITNIGTAYGNERLRFEASKTGFKLGSKVLTNPYGLAGAVVTYNVLDQLDEFSGDSYSTKAAAFDMITNLFGRDILPTDKGATIFKTNPKFKKIGEGGLKDFFATDNLNSDGYLSGEFVYNVATTLSTTIAYVQELSKAPFKMTKDKIRNRQLGRGDRRFKVNKENTLRWDKRLKHKIKGSEGIGRRISQINHNQKMIMFENMADGRSRGLSPEQAFMYGQATTFATGVSQAILPDYNWFKSVKGMTAKTVLTKALKKIKKGTASRVAFDMATRKAFKSIVPDMAGEFLEEGLDMALNDVVKGAFLTNYSPEIQDANAVGQMLSATFVLTAALGLSKGAKNFRGYQGAVYNYYQGNASKVVNEIDFQLQAIKDASKVLDRRTRLGKELDMLLKEEKQKLDQTRSQAILYKNALGVSPKNATVEQINLIIKKQKLQKQREGLDGAATGAVDEKISRLNEKIKNSSEQMMAERLMQKGIDNMVKILGKGKTTVEDGEIFVFEGEDYADAQELENIRIREINERYDDSIKEIDKQIFDLKKEDKGLKRKDKKNTEKIEKLKTKKAGLTRSKSGAIDNVDGPGFFYKDKKSGKWVLIVNKNAARQSNNYAVAQHEVLHALLSHMATKNPKLIKAMGFALMLEMQNNPELRNSYVMQKFAKYDKLKDGSLDWEEMMPIFSEALTQGNITLSEGFLSKMVNIVRRVMREGGYTARIYNSKDVVNFIKDYNVEFKRGRFSKGMQSIKENGLKVRDGKMAKFVKDASNAADIQSQVSGSLAVAKGKGPSNVDVEQDPIKKGKKSMEFDESFDENEMNVVDSIEEEDFSGNEDLVRDLAKGKTNDQWKDGEARKAMDIIQQMEVFDRLIAAKLKVSRSVEDTKIFVADVYAEIFSHVKRFKPEENDDLFAYINSQIRNKAGNVYNNETKDKVLNEANSPEDDNAFIEDIIDEDADLNLDEDNEGKVDVSERLNFFNEAKKIIQEGFALIKEGVNPDKRLEKKRKERLDELGFVDADGNILNLDSLTFLNTPNILFKLIAREFGVDANKLNPYTKFDKNLRRESQQGSNELLNAQMKMRKLGMEFFASILPEGHTSIFSATGISKTKYKVFYNKGKRVNNNFIWHKNPVIDVKVLSEMLGIIDGKSFREDRLAQQSVISMLNILGSQASKQMLVEVSKESGDLNDQIRASIEDGKSKYSKSMFFIQNVDLQKTIREGLPEVGLRIASEGLDHYSEKAFIKKVRQVFRDVYGKTLDLVDDNGKKIDGAAKLADQLMGATGVIMQYGMMASNYKIMGVKMPRDISEFIESNLLSDEKNNLEIFDIFGLSKKNGDKLTKDSVFTKDMIIRGRKNLVDKFEKIEQLVESGVISEGTAYRWIMMMKGMYASQGVLGNNEFMAKKPGSMVLVKSSKKRGEKAKGYITKQYSQVVESAEDYHALLASSKTRFKIGSKFGGKSMLQLRKDYKLPANFEERSRAVIDEIIKGDFDFEARKEQSLEARELVKFMFKNIMVRFNDASVLNESYTAEDVVQEIFMMGSGMESPTRKSAYVYGIAKGLMVDGKYTGNLENVGQELEYDHLHPHHVLMLKASKLIIEGDVKNFNSNMDNAFKDFVVNIIPKTMDNAVKAMGMQYQMQQGYESGLDLGSLNGAFGRLYGDKTFGDERLKAMEILDPKEKGKIIGESYTKLGVFSGKKSIAFTEAIRKNNEMAKNGEVKGISIWDFDDTLARSKSNVLFTAPDGVTGKLTAEEFAKDGARLLDLGYVYDFSEFSKVVDGTKGPFWNKFVKRINKFGIKDNFILTARPENSAIAIQMFLKELGVNIPIENITGLANSTPESKAMWIVNKVSEGYNDIYFADDALPNVQVVENVLNQFDVKSKVRQAKGKQSIDFSQKFNELIEKRSGIDAEKVFSKTKGEKRGDDKGKFRFWIPPSAEDFAGMLYNFLGKGKEGDADMKFFKDALLDPYAKGYNKLNTAKQQVSNEYNKLAKKFGKKKLRELVVDGDFTKEDAVRVYLWNKAGFEVPGISQSDMDELVAVVNKDEDLRAFADALSIVSQQALGYVKPTEQWVAQNIAFDLLQKGNEERREDYLKEFKDNREQIFGKWNNNGELVGPNMNKIEAAFGKELRESFEDMLWRMENGSNRSYGKNKMVNNFMNYINGSIGATMFFNARSAVLQTLSMANFINWEDNNMFNAASAFANQGQFWEDFTYLFQSDMLKQRRSGMTQDLNAAELMQFVTRSKSMSGKMSAAIQFILQKGFLPTQMADSFAIASGGATFYRNRINKLVAEGMSIDKAKKQAFLDFQEIAEATQQSSRPDLISQQQASVLGRLVLAFQNTPMQYSRLQKKAFLDLMDGRGDAKSHISRILYYGFVQNILFYSLQSALFALPFLDDDEEEEFLDGKKERMLQGMLDSSLRGIGVYGAIVATIKNMILRFNKEKDKKGRSNYTYVLLEFANFSPPVGIKLRKLYNATQTYKFNRDEIEDGDYMLSAEAISGVVEATTNLPVNRMTNKINNLSEALNAENATWQRIAMVLGWNRWDVGLNRKRKKVKQSGPRRVTRGKGSGARRVSKKKVEARRVVR